MIKHLLAAALLVSVSSMALADGPLSAYDGTEDLALAPNERVIPESQYNLDGAQEDPAAPMTGTARAFRNGRIQGAAEQKEKDAQNYPPLPPLPKGYAGYPQAAQVAAIPKPVMRQAPAPVYAAPQQQAEVAYQPQPQQYVHAAQPPVVVNVVQPDPRYYQPATDFGRAPSWRNRQEAMEEYGYDPYPPPGYQPPPRPVYIAPQPVYVQPGYVVRSQPRYYQPYPVYRDSGYAVIRGRGWSVGTGW